MCKDEMSGVPGCLAHQPGARVQVSLQTVPWRQLRIQAFPSTQVGPLGVASPGDRPQLLGVPISPWGLSIGPVGADDPSGLSAAIDVRALGPRRVRSCRGLSIPRARSWLQRRRGTSSRSAKGAAVVVLLRSRIAIAQILASGGLGLVFLIDGPFSSCCPHPLPIIEESGRDAKEEDEGLRARTGA